MQPFLSVFVVPVGGISHHTYIIGVIHSGVEFFGFIISFFFLHEDEFNSRLMMYMILPSIFPTAL